MTAQAWIKPAAVKLRFTELDGSTEVYDIPMDLLLSRFETAEEWIAACLFEKFAGCSMEIPEPEDCRP
jgi:hypothetical protein